MNRFKVAMLTLATLGTGIVLQFGNCAVFLGDLLGDTVFLRGID
jgi:hypothetical protein